MAPDYQAVDTQQKKGLMALFLYINEIGKLAWVSQAIAFRDRGAIR